MMNCSFELFKPPYLYNWLPFLGIFLLAGFLTWMLLRSKKKSDGFVLLSGIALLILVAIPLWVALIIFISTSGAFLNPTADRGVSQMNAAIKNTCLVDPKRNNCPQNLDQVLNLYPEDFKKIQDKYTLNYIYYPEDNNYTLVARPKDKGIWDFPRTLYVAVFDQRLVGSEYSKGHDFKNVEAYSCNGKYHLKNPPPFPGPWDNIN